MSEQLINQFLDYITYQRKYSLHSVVSYRTDLFQFNSFLLEQFDIDDLLLVKREHIRTWLGNLNQEKYSAASIKRKISALKSFYNYLLRESLIELNPASRINTPKIPKRLPTFVAHDEINYILDHATEKETFEETLIDLLLSFLYNTGARLTECIHVKDGDVDLSRNVIKVLGKRNKERYIPITEELKQQIIHFQKIKKSENITSDFLFSTAKRSKLYPEYIYRKINKILLEKTRTNKNSPHVLRHSIATHLLHNGAELNAIKELLGHSQLAATQVYTHNNIEELKKAYKQSHPKP